MESRFSTALPGILGAALLFAPMTVQAADIAPDVSIGLGAAAHGDIKLDSQGQNVRLGHFTTFQQSLGFSRPIFNSGAFHTDWTVDIAHESGNVSDVAVDGVNQLQSARFSRTSGFTGVTTSYDISQLRPYVGLALGSVSDKVALAANQYKDNYLAGKAYVGVAWRAHNGFGFDVRASSLRRLD